MRRVVATPKWGGRQAHGRQATAERPQLVCQGQDAGRHREGGSRTIAGPEQESETQPHAWAGARSGGGAISGRADRAYTVGSAGARHG